MGGMGERYCLGCATPAGDDYCDPGVTAVAPQPFGVRQIGTQRSARAIRPVATRAGRPADLTVEDAIAESNLLFGRPCRNGKARVAPHGPGIRMSTFRRFGVIGRRLSRRTRLHWDTECMSERPLARLIRHGKRCGRYVRAHHQRRRASRQVRPLRRRDDARPGLVI